MQRNKQRMFRDRMKKERIDIEELKRRLPCSLEAVDYLGEIYIEGTSKLESELASARRIPESRRKLIDANFLAMEDDPDEKFRSRGGGKKGNGPFPNQVNQHAVSGELTNMETSMEASASMSPKANRPSPNKQQAPPNFKPALINC